MIYLSIVLVCRSPNLPPGRTHVFLETEWPNDFVPYNELFFIVDREVSFISPR